MEKEIGTLSAGGFSFFGITNRLISHELKNILAIISETLGLMEELLALSDKGKELKPGKLHSLSESVIEEVGRANAIIRNMNTFAHSVDEFITEVDIVHILQLMIGICQLDSSLKNTKIQLVSREALMVKTSPLFLENLVYHIIHDSLRDAASDKEIQVSCDSVDHGARIVFSSIASNKMGPFPTPKQNFLAEALSAELSFDASGQEMHIVLPYRIGESPIDSLIVEQHPS
jgi:light-regulated signal transduction histidine kinase (bacteriophytochrome)